MSGPYAMASYMALCGNEIVNQARLKDYTDNGITPNGYRIRCGGCESLAGIVPCVESQPSDPAAGYQLPELDTAPWYDVNVPESRDFAGLLVTNIQMSSPYARTTTEGINGGWTLGRLRPQGRNITVTGWLIGKTCCAATYGLSWLTTALGDAPCASGDCDGCDLDFLACCPNLDPDDGCLVTEDAEGNTTIYTREEGESEYQRAESYFRRMKGAGVVDGPNVLACKGTSCGCGCGALLQVEFTIATSSPYVQSLPLPVVEDATFTACEEDPECDITWCLANEEDGCETCVDCKDSGSCAEDPLCPAPAIPRTPPPSPIGCGCLPQTVARTCAQVSSVHEWGSSTLNIYIYAGSAPLRNLRVNIYQNPQERECDPENFNSECDSCSSFIVSYVPAGGTLRFKGEDRTLTVECAGNVSNAVAAVSSVEGTLFDWPDLSCSDACVCFVTDCEQIADDATFTVERVERTL